MDKILRLKSRLAIDKRGVTLIEILVTLVIVGIVMAAVYEIYLSIQRHGIAQDEIAEMQQNVRIAVDQITKELRIAGYNTNPNIGVVGSLAPADPNSRTLNAANSETVTIRADFDATVAGIEEAAYDIVDLNGSPMLKRCYRIPTDAACPANPSQWPDFVPNITSVVFSFYNNQNTGVAVNTAPLGISNVRRVAVTISGRTRQRTALSTLWGSTGGVRSATFTSDAVLRNFGSTAADTVVPSCPTAIAVQATNNCGELYITWQWQDTTPPAGDLSGFEIFYTGTDLAGTTDTGTVTVADPSARSAYLKKRMNGVQYSIDVRAYDRYFNKNSTCDPLPYPTAVPTNSAVGPNPPTGFRATPSNNQVTLNWNPIDMSIDTNRDVKGYRLYRGITADFTPNSTNMIACERTKSTPPELPPTGCPAGKNILSVPDTETGWPDVTSFVDTSSGAGVPPENCNLYYYKIRAVDQCLVEGDPATVNATPPDNDKRPNTPLITSLVAGDDTSSIIVKWTLPYNPSDTAHSQPDIFRVFYKITGTSSWIQWPQPTPQDIPIDVANPVTLSGTAIINMLTADTPYDVKVSAYDSVAMCRNESDVTTSNTGTISTGACAPKIRWPEVNPIRGGHFIFPGDNVTTGQPLANFSKVGTELDAVANSRFITWVVDPLDCTPDSDTYDRDGFDYSDYPTNSIISSAKVEFYINNNGSVVNTLAHTTYGNSSITTSEDLAPRGPGNYYHWPPNFPLNDNHIDTTRLCNGLKDFKIIARDGEAYTVAETITLEIKNGGIVHNSSQATTTNITTPDDFHNQVAFSLRNSSTVKELKVTKMKLSWGNSLVNLKKIEMLNTPNPPIVLFEDTILPIDTVSGTEVILTTTPNILIGSSATFMATFTKSSDGSVPSTAEMRGTTFSLDSVSVQDNADSTFNCAAASLASLTTSTEPIIGSVVQDKPTPNTSASTTPSLIVPASTDVKVSLPVADLSATVTSVTAKYAVVASGSSTAPIRPSNLTDLGNYPNFPVTMVFDSLTGLWNGTIPFNNNSRIWYFIEAVDSTGNFDISPNIGAYTYAQCGTTLPTLSPITSDPPGPAVNNIVTVEVTVSSAVGIENVVLFTLSSDSALVVPITAMTQVSPGLWRGSYNASTSTQPHVLRVKATDNCGNQQEVTKTFTN